MTEPTKPIDDGLQQKLNTLFKHAFNAHEFTDDSDGQILFEVNQAMNLITADRQQLLDRVEKIIGPNFSNWGELETEEQRVESAKNELKNEQRTALAKLWKELGL